jgi:nucleoside phosphorylase
VVLNHDVSADAIRALGYDPEERLDLGTGDGTVLASGDVFVTDQLVRARLAEHADLVDMEAYGVALACHRLGVRLELVKHVSDNADESAFDWPTLVDASARVLGAWVDERLGSPA